MGDSRENSSCSNGPVVRPERGLRPWMVRTLFWLAVVIIVCVVVQFGAAGPFIAGAVILVAAFLWHWPEFCAINGLQNATVRSAMDWLRGRRVVESAVAKRDIQPMIMAFLLMMGSPEWGPPLARTLAYGELQLRLAVWLNPDFDVMLPNGYRLVRCNEDEVFILRPGPEHGFQDVAVLPTVRRIEIAGEVVYGDVSLYRPFAKDLGDDRRGGLFVLNTRTGETTMGLDGEVQTNMLRALGVELKPLRNVKTVAKELSGSDDLASQQSR